MKVCQEIYTGKQDLQKQSLLVKKTCWPGMNIMGNLLTEMRENHDKKLKQNKHSQKSYLTQKSDENGTE